MLPLQTALLQYQEGLDSAAALARHARAPSTNQQRNAAVSEFLAWCQQQPLSMKGPINLMTATPEDVLAYSKRWRDKRSQGRPKPAPGVLSSMLSHLSTAFRLAGRHGAWDVLALTGNPIESQAISDHRTGYRKEQWDAGYAPSSAPALSPEVLDQLLAGEELKYQQSNRAVEQLSLLRDMTLYSYLYASLLRGTDAGRLTLQDIIIQHPSGVHTAQEFLQSFGFSRIPDQPQYVVYVVPHGSKTRQFSPGEALRLPAPGPQPSPRSVLYQLNRLLLESQRHGAPITGYVFRPASKQQAAGPSFDEKPLSSSALWHRLTNALKDHHLYRGQSVHSTRRGAMQSMQAAGHSLEAISRAATIKTPAIRDLYLDVTREVKRRRF